MILNLVVFLLVNRLWLTVMISEVLQYTIEEIHTVFPGECEK